MIDSASLDAGATATDPDMASHCRKRSPAVRRPILSGALVLGCLAACSPVNPPSPAMLPGSDRELHGCIPSAGYSWCVATSRCERPWELAAKHGFDRSLPAFDRFCGNPARQDAPSQISAGGPA